MRTIFCAARTVATKVAGPLPMLSAPARLNTGQQLRPGAHVADLALEQLSPQPTGRDAGLRSTGQPETLSYMAQYSSPLDEVFAALADPTRRAVVGTLGRGPASVGDLARSASMTLPSFMKHVHTLERCGLIRTAKSGRVRTCTLDRNRLDVVDGWLAEQRAGWQDRTDRLEQFVTQQEPS